MRDLTQVFEHTVDVIHPAVTTPPTAVDTSAGRMAWQETPPTLCLVCVAVWMGDAAPITAAFADDLWLHVDRSWRIRWWTSHLVE